MQFNQFFKYFTDNQRDESVSQNKSETKIN